MSQPTTGTMVPTRYYDARPAAPSGATSEPTVGRTLLIIGTLGVLAYGAVRLLEPKPVPGARRNPRRRTARKNPRACCDACALADKVSGARR